MGYGYSRQEFENLCEKEYYDQLSIAKYDIKEGKYSTQYSYSANPRGWGGTLYLDFDRYIAVQIQDKWTAKLRNEISDYYDQYCQEKRRKKLQEERMERERQEEKRRQYEEEERECQEKKRREHEEEERREACKREANRKSSLKTLTSTPYNFSEADASRFISYEGEIEEDELAKYENARRNKELIAKKAAEWEAMKGNQQNVASSSAIICPNCGNSAKDTDKFCRACGTAIQKECPSCKKLLPINNKFCTACGTKL